MTATVIVGAPTIVIDKIVRRAAKIGFGGTKLHCSYWVETKIDEWLVVRAHIKRDTFEYLKDRGVVVVEEIAPPAPLEPERKKL